MRLKITKSSLIIWIALLVYLKPANVVLWTNVNLFYQIIKIIITFIIISKFIKNSKIDKEMLFCLLFLTIWAISIFLNNGSLVSRAQELLSILGLLFLLKWISYSDKKILTTFSIVDKIAKVYLILELITIIMDKPLFAEALVTYDKYFLGSDNYSAFIIIPLTGIMCVYSQIKYRRITLSTWFFSIIGFLDLAIPFSVTGMFVYLLMLFLFMFINNPEIRRLFTIKKVGIAGFIFLILVLGIHIQDYFSCILTLLGKVGLNSREIIWPKVINAIFQKPLLGWGKLTEEQISSYLLYGADHAHNIFLEILLDSGVIGGFVFFYWIIGIFKGIKFYNIKYINLLYACFACYIICGMFDFYLPLIYFWLLIFSFDLLKQHAMYENMENII